MIDTLYSREAAEEARHSHHEECAICGHEVHAAGKCVAMVKLNGQWGPCRCESERKPREGKI